MPVLLGQIICFAGGCSFFVFLILFMIEKSNRYFSNENNKSDKTNIYWLCSFVSVLVFVLGFIIAGE